MKRDNRRYYGEHASRAIMERRPEDVTGIYFDKAQEERHKKAIAIGRSLGLPVKAVGEADLERLTKSDHHQGICLAAREPDDVPWDAWIRRAKNEKRMLALYLDGVANPHNIGALLRSSAHFGVEWMIGDGKLPRLSPAAVRTAEGGAESTGLVRFPSGAQAIRELKGAGFRIVATTMRGGKDHFQHKFPEKCVLLLGSEVEGVSEEIFRMADEKVAVLGTGRVQSLNVNVAASVLMAEWRRLYPLPKS